MNDKVDTSQSIEDVQELQIFLKTLSVSNDGKARSHSANNLVYKLKHLNISSSELTQIPIEICQLKYLTVLNLSDNHLVSLPNEIGNLCNLITLQLSRNKLNCLPKSLRSIQQLHCLDISHNEFFEVPDVLCYGLRVLKVLDLSHNKISSFNDPPACLNKLLFLCLSCNKLMQVPVWIFHSPCHLQILDVSGNQICFDSVFVNLCGSGILDSLRVLNIENCNYSCANNQILSVFKNLEVLQLGNKIDSNDKRIGRNYCGNFTMNTLKNLRYIKYLYLQNVQIATLPSDFDYLENIHTLDLSNNFLSWLPECFCNLTSLKTLYLTSNQLLFLPSDIGNLVNLQQIHLGNNKLYKLPESFYNLVNLEYVDFYNNNIEEIEEKIFRQVNLKGIDLGLNCVTLNTSEYNAETGETNMSLYEHLKNSFRKSFCVLDCRSDIQGTGLKASDGLGSNSQKLGSSCSTNSCESEQYSDFEDSPVADSSRINNKNDLENEDWERVNNEDEDELFDPNRDSASRPSQDSGRLLFQKNYCPANYHVPSLMKTYVRNFKLALKKEVVEEGQFDSD